MTSSFNAFGSPHKEWGNPSVPVWLGKVRAVPVGGSLDSSNLVKGALYAAGTPISLVNKVIKVFVAFKVVAFNAAAGGDTITIKPYTAGDVTILPAANDLIQKVGSTFSATAKAGAVVSVAAGATAGTYDVSVAHEAVDSLSEGDFIALSAAESAGSSKNLAVIPNAYLYNDIYLGDIDVNNEMAGASGAAVMFHGEGILIQRTPAADFADAMKAAVPHVLQVNG